MKYFIHINGQQQGPFEEKELLLHGVTAQTPVWCEGMAEWQPAGQVAALSYLFASNAQPTQYPQQPQYQQPQYGSYSQQQGPMPDNHMVWGILVTIFCCLPFGIVSIIKAADVSSKYNTGDYQGAVEASKSAKNWAMWGAIAGVAGGILYLIASISAGLFSLL